MTRTSARQPFDVPTTINARRAPVAAFGPTFTIDELTPIDVPHVIEVWVSDHRVDITMRGEFDLATMDDTAQSLALLRHFSTAVWVDLTDVGFIDSSGIDPLVELDRARANAGLPRLQIGARSRRAQRVLDLTGLRGAPELDLDAWDRPAIRPNPKLEGFQNHALSSRGL
ncbi:MAG: STAS domain-containing protein [Jatrophihabitantaceae bacterium]